MLSALCEQQESEQLRSILTSGLLVSKWLNLMLLAAALSAVHCWYRLSILSVLALQICSAAHQLKSAGSVMQHVMFGQPVKSYVDGRHVISCAAF
jgi:hypothetical protein